MDRQRGEWRRRARQILEAGIRRAELRQIRGNRRAAGSGSVAFLAVGFIFVLLGFGLIVYVAWTTGSLPLNDTTYAGVGFAGLGIGAGAIGFDRGVKVHG